MALRYILHLRRCQRVPLIRPLHIVAVSRKPPLQNTLRCCTRQDPTKVLLRSSSNFRPGDWLCPMCQGHNFARNTHCFSCRETRPADSLRFETTSDEPAQIVRRDGDWDCEECGVLNFARRGSCFRCSAPPPAGHIANSNPSQTTMRLPGDWDCACGGHNYASRMTCFRCNEPKAEEPEYP